MSRRLLWSLAIVLVVAACAGSGEPSTESTSESTTTAWGSVVSGITGEGVPLQVALAAFSLAVGPLPGVEAPEGAAGGIRSGTGAVRWVLGHWDELSTEQQAVVADYLSPPGASRRGPVLAMSSPVPVAAADEQALLELIAELENVIADNLGRELGVPIELHVAPGLTDGQADALTTGTDSGGGLFGPMARCEITLTQNGSELAESVETGSESEVLLRSLMAHEVFHCFEMALSINLAESYVRPSWVVEGLAEWAGETVSGGTHSINSGWPRWLEDAPFSLYLREYSAIGFYAHLAEHGADVWSAIDHIIEGSDGGNEPAYLAAVGAAGPDALPTWGPGYFRDPNRAPAWDQNGPGITLEHYPAHNDFPEIAAGTEAGMAVSALGADIWETSLSAEVVSIGATGFGMLLLPDGVELTLEGTLEEVLCTDPAVCSCPEGSPGAGVVFRVSEPGPARVGLTGHLEGSQATITGWSLDAFCQGQVAECLVGTWESVSYNAAGQEILEGTGAGVTLSIDEQGRGLIDFDPMIPILSRVEGGVDVPWVRVVQTGQAYLEVSPTPEGGVINSAVGVDYTIRAEVDLGGGFVPAGDEFSMSGASTGPGVTLTCEGDTLTWTGAAGVASYEFDRTSANAPTTPEAPPEAVPLDGGSTGGGEGSEGGIPQPPADWGLGLDACLLLTIEEVRTIAPDAGQPPGEDAISSQFLHQCTFLPALALTVVPPQPPEFSGDAAAGIGFGVVPIEGIGDWAQAFTDPAGDRLVSLSAGSDAGAVTITPYAQVTMGSPEYDALLELLEIALGRLS